MSCNSKRSGTSDAHHRRRRATEHGSAQPARPKPVAGALPGCQSAFPRGREGQLLARCVEPVAAVLLAAHPTLLPAWYLRPQGDEDVHAEIPHLVVAVASLHLLGPEVVCLAVCELPHHAALSHRFRTSSIR